MMLSDADIEAELTGIGRGPIAFGRDLLRITPITLENVQPASVDLTLGRNFKRYSQGRHEVVDPLDLPNDLMQDHWMKEGGSTWIMPGELLLGRTIERVEIPSHLFGRMEGKSSLGRLGLLVHSSAGFFDPGFRGTCTLEMYNFAPYPIRLHYAMRICQMSFGYLNTPCRKPYGHPDLGSKYQDQEDATASRYGQAKEA